MLAYFVLVLFVAGCLDTSVEEAPEPEDVNFPPHIDDAFLEPPEDVLHVESDDPVVLTVSTLLDPDPEDQLHYAFVGERSGIVVQATSSRRPEEELYRDLFFLFDRAEVEIDPCAERLRGKDDELIRLFVSDRPFQRVTETGVDIDDEGHLDTHRWLLRFRPQLCQ